MHESKHLVQEFEHVEKDTDTLKPRGQGYTEAGS